MIRQFLSKEKRLNFTNEIFELSVFYEVHDQTDICRDPKDNKFLDVAIVSHAEFLITGDEDLLILERIEKTSIITPRNFVDIL